LFIIDKVIVKLTFSSAYFLLATAVLLTTLLSGCVTQKYENDAPVVQNQANLDEMAATRISLGLGYLKMGNMAQAKLNLEKAKRFSPKLVQVYTAFAHYYEVVGENELTRQSYEKALSIKADDADTLNNYGVFLCRQNDMAAAEVQFLSAIAVPSYLLVAQSYQNLASCYLQIDDFNKAEQYLNKAIDHSPNRAATLLQMVRLQYAKAQYKEATEYQQKFERNTRRFTADSLALAYKVYRKLGQRRTASNYGTMLMKMYPQSWESKQYLLNELAEIDADNLAKRYRATLLKNNASSDSEKNKKRTVKLSPKSKATASATASLAKIKAKTTKTKAVVTNKVTNTVNSLRVEEQLPEKEQQVYHQVIDGETLYAISIKYNIKMQALRKWNNLSAKHKLKIKEKIYVVDPKTVINSHD
jgi:type IV pilus assembly protein PilF